jgi:septal ring factor EnvC (AmiA/AmiB activator)
VWSTSSVSRILKSETYAGKWRYAKKTQFAQSLVVKVPAIVSRGVWEAAQRRARDCDAPGFRSDQVDRAVWQWIGEKLSDPKELRKELETRRAEQEAENAPLRERLSVVNDLVAENQAQLERLLDLYLSGEFPQEMLTERKARLEATIDALEKERRDLAVTLEARTLTNEDIQSLEDFARAVEEAFVVINDDDFGAKRAMIEWLDVQARLVVEDGLKVAYVSSPVLGKSKRLPVVSNDS